MCAGGNGYINDYPSGRLLRDAKLYEIGAGTSEVRRLVIARAINAHYKWLHLQSFFLFFCSVTEEDRDELVEAQWNLVEEISLKWDPKWRSIMDPIAGNEI